MHKVNQFLTQSTLRDAHDLLETIKICLNPKSIMDIFNIHLTIRNDMKIIRHAIPILHHLAGLKLIKHNK